VFVCVCVVFRVMLEYIDSAVTRNASEKKINSLLDFMAQAQDVEVLQVGVAWAKGLSSIYSLR